jgi:hypothetical protein
MSASLSAPELIVVVASEAAPTLPTPAPAAGDIRAFTQLQTDLKKSKAFFQPLFEYPIGRALAMTVKSGRPITFRHGRIRIKSAKPALF